MKTNQIYLILILLLIENSIEKKKDIFDETKIKKMKLKNRLFRGSVGDYCFLKDGHITEEGLKLYEKLSDDGVGTIFTGYTTVSDYDQFENSGVFRIDKDEYIEEYKKLSNIVHKNNIKIILDLIHPGIFIKSGIEQIYSPSNIIHPLSKVKSKELTKEDILQIEDDFLNGAIRAKKSGFDGIELHCAHLTLLSQFLSPGINKRNDEYGGNDENRVRIIIEIIQKIRKEVGEDFIISIKLNCDDGIENGITINGFLNTCKLIEKAGADIIQVSGNFINKPQDGPYFYNEAKQLSNVINIPVSLIGGIRDMETMENILNDSNIQYFGFGRPLLCEPDLIKKWENGERSKYKCIGFMGCLKTFSHKCVYIYISLYIILI